ncbi:MAG TPA: VWA domain-containing protein [Vicinamibacterales bacterium]|mgnify:FL=1|nr:VWA domain-containing protein [Vicinamibacterales bacterium]HOQ60777.1 VWA domain-containing protein [Vicinamibacterales bacterium]HPK72030.1 VWA domain-containing protein [Vicinamibacterales bacterium]
MHRLRASVAAVLVGASFAAAGSAPQQAAQPAFRPPQSQPAAAQPQEPVFRSGVDLVPVDVIVVDKDGRPIVGLAPEDFSVTVEGRPRRVVSAEFLSHADRFATAPDRTQVPTLNVEDRVMMRAEYSSNTRSAPGRLFVLAVDAGNMTRGGGRGAMEAARQFVQTLAPNDLVALVTLPAGVTVDFTADRAAIREALLKVTGGGANKYLANVNVSLTEALALQVGGDRKRIFENAVRMECGFARSDTELQNCRMNLEAEAQSKLFTARASAQSSSRALEFLIRRLALIEGQKHVIFIGESLVTGASFGLLEGSGDLAWLGSLSQAARVNLYVLHLDRAFLEAFDVLERFPSRTPLEDARLLNDGLGELAGQAGGAYFNLTVAIDPAFERIARETSASYLVAFEPAPDDRDGKAHNVSIKVARPGVHVRARRQFTVDPAAASASMAQRVTRALNSPHLPVTVPMDLTTYVIGDSRAGGVRVLMAAEIGCGAGTTADFEVGHLVTDSSGRGAGSAVQRPAGLIERGGGVRCVYYSSGFGIKSGEYVVRAVAIDSANRAGGVERRLDARLAPAGPLGLSSLVLTDPAVRVDDKMKLVVDGRVAGPSVAAYVEMRRLQPAVDAPAAALRPAVQFEVARAEDGPALVGTVPPVADEADGGAWYAEGAVSLATLAPGSYVVRALVTWDGRIVGRASRSIILERAASQ